MTEASAGTSLVAQVAARTTEQVSSVIVGKEEQVNLLLVALLSEGHVLIDDVPGVAKTLLAKTLAAALGLRFARVQCTPDLLPADVTGSEVTTRRRASSSSAPARSSPTSSWSMRSTAPRRAPSRASWRPWRSAR